MWSVSPTRPVRSTEPALAGSPGVARRRAAPLARTPSMAPAALTPDELLGRTLLAVAVVVAVTQLLAPVLRRLGQPAVLAQVLAGILLGPALLGALPGSSADWLFPADVRAALSAVGGIGLVLFLFLMGLQLDLPRAASGGRRLAAVTAGSVAVPFALGVLAAVTVLAGREPDGVGGLAFAVFIGTALSVSALPVLARILDERGLTHSRVGQLALASASLQDAVAWLLLAASLALAASGPSELLRALAGLAALSALLALVVRPLLAGRLGARLGARGSGDGAALGAVAVGLLGCAALTQLTGLHAALGALAFGAAFPRGVLVGVRVGIERAVGPLTRGVLLPVFFLVPGLSFTLDDLGGSSVPVILALFACATAGKLIGAGVPALMGGLPRREAAAVAVLLNTRGLVELIVLNVALTNGVIDAGLYSELAIVALATTFMTGPLLRRIAPGDELHRGSPSAPEDDRAGATTASARPQLSPSR